MSYNNFIPNVFAAEINKELRRLCVFADGTYQRIAGKISGKGESVTFVGIGKPTIRTILKGARNNNISAAEEIEDNSLIMPINTISYFNYKVGDIDKAQAAGNILGALKEETNEALANEVDKYIAKLAVAADAKLLSSSATSVTNQNAMQTLDAALEVLYKNDVAKNAYIEAIVTPYFYIALKQQYQNLDTDNSGILANGKVGKYGNVVIKMSNNVHNDGTNDYIMVRTKRAIGYAKPITHTEAYRPELGFADAVKGFILYDAKIIRPNEMVVVKCAKG